MIDVWAAVPASWPASRGAGDRRGCLGRVTRRRGPAGPGRGGGPLRLFCSLPCPPHHEAVPCLQNTGSFSALPTCRKFSISPSAKRESSAGGWPGLGVHVGFGVLGCDLGVTVSRRRELGQVQQPLQASVPWSESYLHRVCGIVTRVTTASTCHLAVPPSSRGRLPPGHSSQTIACLSLKRRCLSPVTPRVGTSRSRAVWGQPSAQQPLEKAKSRAKWRCRKGFILLATGSRR